MRLGAAAFAFVLLLSGTLAGCTQPVPVGAVELRIGALLPLDESAARALAPALDLAVRQVNDGALNVKIILDKERVAPGSAAAGFDRLATRGSVAIVDMRGPTEAQSLVDHANANKKALLILPAVTNATRATNSLAVGLYADPAGEGEALAALATKLGAKTFAIVREESPYGYLVTAGAKARLANFLISETSYAVDNDRAAAQAARAACDVRAEAVLFVGYPTDFLRALEGLQPCRTRVHVVASAGIASLDVTAGSSEGQLVKGITGVALQSASPLVFGSLYRNVYETSPPPFAAEAYDAVNDLALAALAARPVPAGQNTPSPSPLNAEELRVKLVSVTTPPGIRFNDFGLAASAARAGDEIEWRGYSHDSAAQQKYVAWRLGEDARVVYDAATV